MNAMYIKKGWNQIGEKLGDFTSVGLFAGKTLFKNVGLTLQVRGELMAKTRVFDHVFYDNDPEATGYKKVFFTPQLSYTRGKFTLYA